MYATLNVTWNGQNGNLNDPILYDATDTDIRAWAEEAVKNGDIAGIDADTSVDLTDFEVVRFPLKDGATNTIFCRPKTPFGG